MHAIRDGFGKYVSGSRRCGTAGGVVRIGWFGAIAGRGTAGLSHGTLVVEGERRSGSLITAGCALTEGRDVFAVPGNVDASMSAAPNWLIREGATMVRDAGDILEDYHDFDLQIHLRY